MLLRHTFHLEREAACVEEAVSAVLSLGARTADLARAGPAVSTADMGKRVVEAVGANARSFA
jgi:3-isopropylmalate dehydrogenase